MTLDEQRELLEVARAGEPAARRRALDALLHDFRGPALAAIHKTLAAGQLGGEHAEEALQAAILKFLAGGLQRFRGEAAPRTYFVRIALHAAIDLLRLQQRQVDDGEERLLGLANAETGGPERSLHLGQVREALERCLEELPQALRQSVALYYLGTGEDCEACARKIGIRKNAFEQRLRRSRLALAECLGRKGAL